jgi:hypothetical protein
MLNRQKSYKYELIEFETGFWIKLGKILEIQHSEKSFQIFSRNDEDWNQVV